MELSQEQIEEMKKLLEKHSGKEVSSTEAEESLRNLTNLVQLMWDIWRRDEWRKKRLETEPDGFLLDGSYTCFICGLTGDICYDRYGYSCRLCLAARKKHIIPVEAYRKKDSWYAMWEFDSYFGAKSATIRKFVRNGKLKARIVPDENGKPHYYLFMIKENAGFLPTKPKREAINENGRISISLEKFPSPFVA